MSKIPASSIVDECTFELEYHRIGALVQQLGRAGKVPFTIMSATFPNVVSISDIVVGNKYKNHATLSQINTLIPNQTWNRYITIAQKN